MNYHETRDAAAQEASIRRHSDPDPRAEADQAGQAEIAAARPIDNGGTDGAGMGYKGYISAEGAGRRQEGCVQRQVRVQITD